VIGISVTFTHQSPPRFLLSTNNKKPTSRVIRQVGFAFLVTLGMLPWKEFFLPAQNHLRLLGSK